LLGDVVFTPQRDGAVVGHGAFPELTSWVLNTVTVELGPPGLCLAYVIGTASGPLVLGTAQAVPGIRPFGSLSSSPRLGLAVSVLVPVTRSARVPLRVPVGDTAPLEWLLGQANG